MNEQGDHIRLQLQGDQLLFTASTEDEENKISHGSLSSIRKVLEPDRLTGAGLENAITQIEDLIMPILRSLPKRNMLEVYGSELENIFQLLSPTNDGNVSLESVENLYSQLADYAEGSPVAWRHVSTPEHVALGLVLLRELMHHGSFRFVSLSPRTI